jgi:acylphosphatase
MKHFAIIVSGRVQGVFFRASAKEQADLFDIKGFVRNEFNGDVYIEAEGSDYSMDSFIKWCHQGPPTAIVSSVKLIEKNLEGYTSFEVRRK